MPFGSWKLIDLEAVPLIPDLPVAGGGDHIAVQTERGMEVRVGRALEPNTRTAGCGQRD